MTTDNDEPTLNGVESLDAYMEKNRNSLTSIKDRLPATLGRDPRRALIFAIRNPDASLDEIGAATSTEPPNLYAGLLDLALDRDPDTDDLADAQRAVLDMALDGEFDPDSRRSDWDTIARAAGRRAGTLTSKNPVRSFVSHEKFDERLDRRRVEIALAGRTTGSDIRHLLDEMGLRRLLVALGEDPPAENIDPMPDDNEPDRRDDITHLTARHTADDLDPGVEYHAEVNNVVGYGIFVTVGGQALDDDISGLVHQSTMPPFIRAGDFEVGDQVSVYLVERRENGDLSFSLASVIDAARFDVQEFEPNTEYVDRREDDEPEQPDEWDTQAPQQPAGPSGDEPTATERSGGSGGGDAPVDRAKAAVRNHGEWRDGELYCAHCGHGPIDGPFGMSGHLRGCPEYETRAERELREALENAPKQGSMDHEVATRLLERGAVDRDSAITSTDLKGEIESGQDRSITARLSRLNDVGLVDRDESVRPYEHWLTDPGEAWLDRIGEFVTTTPRAAADGSDDGWDEPDYLSEPNSPSHEVLTIVGQADGPITAGEVGEIVTEMKKQSASGYLSHMKKAGFVDRESIPSPGGGPHYAYTLDDRGREFLDTHGPHPAQAEPEPEEPAMPDKAPDPDAIDVGSIPSDISWTDPEPAPEPTEEPEPAAEDERPDPLDELADMRDDLLVRAAMMMGRHDLDAADVADTLREVASRLEDRR